MSVVTRFAPSPTGSLHIGGLRSALFSWAWARKNNGKFLLRIEDTDRQRFVKGTIKEIIDILQEFGINFDNQFNQNQINDAENSRFNWYTHDWALHLDEIEKTDTHDFENTYIQSQRIRLYQYYALKLIKEGFAYFCFCSKERLENLRKKQLQAKERPRYDRYCRLHVSYEEALERIEAGEKPVVRFDMQAFYKKYGKNTLEFTDTVVGKVRFDLKQEGDFVILKSDGFPTYHLAVVVDDYHMGVTHVIRGYEWISSVPKHIGLYYALGFRLPEFVHLPVILDPSGGKLSKRKGSVAVVDFLREGYLKEALLNFLMFLGYNPITEGEEEILSLERFVERFDIHKIHRSNPIFNREKLDWFNKVYMRDTALDKFSKEFKTWLNRFKDHIIEKIYQYHKEHEGLIKDGVISSKIERPLFRSFLDKQQIKKVVEQILNDRALDSKLLLVKERTTTLFEALYMILFFYADFVEYDYKLVKGVKKYEKELLENAFSEVLKKSEQLVKSFSDEEEFNTAWVEMVRKTAAKNNIKPRDLFMYVRLKLTGHPVSVPLVRGVIERGVLIKSS